MQRIDYTLAKERERGLMAGKRAGLLQPRDIRKIKPNASFTYIQGYHDGFDEARVQLKKEGPLRVSDPQVLVAAYAHRGKAEATKFVENYPLNSAGLNHELFQQAVDQKLAKLVEKLSKVDQDFCPVYFRMGFEKKAEMYFKKAIPSRKSSAEAQDPTEERESKRRRMNDVVVEMREDVIEEVIEAGSIHPFTPPNAVTERSAAQINWQFFSLEPARLQVAQQSSQPKTQRHILVPVSMFMSQPNVDAMDVDDAAATALVEMSFGKRK